MILRNKDEYSSQEKETSESEENERKKKKEIENPSEGLFEKEEKEYPTTPLTSIVKKEFLKGHCIDKYVVDYFEHVLRYHQHVKVKLSIGIYKDKFLCEVVPKETCHVLLRLLNQVVFKL